MIHPDFHYASPLLQTLTSKENENSYASAAGVKQCSDHSYFAKLIPKLCNPFVDMECVISQAQALFPNIVEAGKNVIRLFIPRLSVEITSLDKDLLKGEIAHKTDLEKYTGEVILIIKDQNNKNVDKIKVIARDGRFERGGIKLAKDEKVLAMIEFGGVSVESSEIAGRGE